MNNFSNKSKPIEAQIEYSEKWFDENPDKGLRDLYSDFLKVKIGDHDPFIMDLSERIRSFFSIPFEKIQSLSEFELYTKLPEDQKIFLKSLDDKDFRNWYDELVTILKDIYAETIIESLKKKELKHSLSRIKSNIPALCERCFSYLVFDSLKGVEVVKQAKLFQIADTRILFLDIFETTLNPDFFDGHLFRLCNGDSQKRINKWYSIAIDNIINRIDNLTDEEQIALIPDIELLLKHEQNYKRAKSRNYLGIEGLEDFYLIILNRFEKKLREFNEKKENEKFHSKIDDLLVQIKLYLGRGGDYILIQLKKILEENFNKLNDELKKSAENIINQINNYIENKPDHLEVFFKKISDQLSTITSKIENRDEEYKNKFETIDNRLNFINEKLEKEAVKSKKYFFSIGVKSIDTDKSKQEKIDKFRKFFKANKQKFSKNYKLSEFDSLYDSRVKYVEKFDFEGDILDLLELIVFLKTENIEIITQNKIWKVVKSRFLIKGDDIDFDETQLAQKATDIKFEKTSKRFRELNSCLE